MTEQTPGPTDGMAFDFKKKIAAEALGTALLLAVVVGSGIMGESLAAGNDAIALLGNTIATGTALVILILIFGPVSGAHFNPAVTLAFALRRELSPSEAIAYAGAQVIGGILGVWLAHIMFDLSIFQQSEKVRAGLGQGVAEMTATFGLVLTILGCLRFRSEAIPYAVGLYITAGYWFTASTSFANPAVTIARTLSNTFAGIRPADAPTFIVMQLVGAVLATLLAYWLFTPSHQRVQ